MKAIFLDFDGVLIPAVRRSGLGGDPHCVCHLNTVTNRTDAKIVVSSSWRDEGLSSIRKRLKHWGVVGEVIDVTPRLVEGVAWKSAIRGEEIQAWLSQHTEVTAYVILDDDDDMGVLCSHLVQTNSLIGLTEKHSAWAIQVLNAN